MSDAPAGILLLESRIASAELERLVGAYFGDMVKFVVDLRPSLGNRGMQIEDEQVREQVRERVLKRIGRGEALWHDLDARALGYRVEETIAGERATHVIVRRKD